jgi:SAM-dependent methyltransferase
MVPSWRTPDWTEFPYGECSDCGSLTLLSTIDPGPFYEGYELHHPAATPTRSVARLAAGAIAERLVFPRGPFGRLVGSRLRRPEWLSWFAASGLGRDTRVVDVGAGNGGLLAELERWGFHNLVGVDQYLPDRRIVSERVCVEVGDLASVDGPCGLVLFHHSLEHVDDPVGLLHLARSHVAAVGGRVAVSLPVAEGPVWEEYRDNWVALDAPVHRLIPSLEGMRRLADRAGLSVVSTHRSCAARHVVRSELIARRVPDSVPVRHALSQREHEFLVAKARVVHRSGQGPQATFALALT